MTTEQDAPPVRQGDATEAEAPRGRTRPLAAVLRVARHEWTLAVLGGLLLAVVLTWPTLRDPTRTLPQDIGDPVLQAWQVAWGGHALLTQPGHLWDSNTFFPEPYTYAYSDTLLGYALAGMIGSGPEAAVLRYNILYVLVHALAFVGAYALARQLGANRIGAAVAGAGFAYAPWRLAQAGHLHVLSVGGIALALAMLARGHGWSLRYGYRPHRRRPGWALSGWLVAAWQITLGFGIGLPFGYALGLLCLGAAVGYGWSWWRRRARPPFGGRLLAADLGGGAIFAAVTLFMARPYLEVVARFPEGRRTLEQVEMFSPPLRGFFTAPPESWLWGERHAAARETLSFPGEMTLLPGVVLIGLACTGLFFSAWRVWHRVLLTAGVLVSVALASGTEFADHGAPGYATLVRYAPGWDAIRTPGRLVLWTTLLLGILAAGALTRSDPRPAAAPASGDTPVPAAGPASADTPDPADARASGGAAASADARASGGAAASADARASGGAAASADAAAPAVPRQAGAVDDAPGSAAGPGGSAGTSPRTGWLLRLAAIIPLALVIVEGVNTTPHPQVLPQPAALRGAAGPLLVLPSDGLLEFSVMLWATDGFPKMVNGLASFTPASQAQTRAATTSFPDSASVAYLRQLGIRTVIVLPGYAAGSPWQDVVNRPVDGLGIRREVIADAVVFRLD
ncbi:hypothetical protein AB0J86_14920 [Micromonospora sp. NPDC049559]|uniref:hypothetical protein n=1 Tax=Micromonospora sp. NPDC049559 TaxID=3155923 RepID=UPI00341DE659